MWVEAAISFACYCTVGVLFFYVIPPAHPRDKDAQQYYAYYSTHVSLVHCFVSLILSKTATKR